MSAYLRTPNSFEIRSATVTDAVLDNDQTVQFIQYAFSHAACGYCHFCTE